MPVHKVIPFRRESNRYATNASLVSFENFSLPNIATYRVDEDGSGAFYPGDEDYTYLSAGVFVNAWMPLPELYREE